MCGTWKFRKGSGLSAYTDNIAPVVKGVGGGSRVKFLFRLHLIGSETLEYVLPGTFYRIEKAFSIAEI